MQATILEAPIAALLKEGRAIMEFADAHALPVLFHTSIIPTDQFSQVADCLRVAEAFPRVRFNLAHSLRFDEPGLRRAAKLPNVWVDCSAHLAHCGLAREGSLVVAAKQNLVDADYARPAQVLETIHHLLGGSATNKYLWGSDNPFMSWCDDTMRSIFSYREEADVLHALPAAVRESMATRGPEAWLLGKR
ncbi:MAG: amidohydrolase family protein [Planctomycetota bacterium]|nr:amidohydrolase family protein [Planctomycetota bacterium]